MTRALMVQGTGSDVGKSLLVAGLARALTRRGLRVRPFKPQNMSNNAAVTADGGEIGRAQALQARACGIMPTSDMNPVLLKPQSDGAAQIVLCGRVHGSLAARDYRTLAPKLLPDVLAAFDRLAAEADLVLVEGAGSPAEINLRQADIANMGFAEAADVPVALVGDIERGGVIAQLVGTHALLSAAERARLVGYVVNKFRGDARLFASGMDLIAAATGWEPLGLIPFFPEARLLPAEDALALAAERPEKEGARVKIAVPILPHIANFDDLDPLDAEPSIELVRVKPGSALPGDAALVILPGSKATVADLTALRDAGFDIDVVAHLRRGGAVLGLCGGYQMLGRTIDDPEGIEGKPGLAEGLNLLDVETTLSGEKRLEKVEGETSDGVRFAGYEMHMGVTEGPDRSRPFAKIGGAPEGAMSADGRVIGTYIHGLFADDRQRAAWLKRLGACGPAIAYDHLVDETLDKLAAHLSANVDLDRLLALAR
jgi:adenosylcobyric acid synthase